MAPFAKPCMQSSHFNKPDWATSQSNELSERLRALARSSDWFAPALQAARQLGLSSWCLGAGAVRNLVWDHLHGYATPSPLADLDLAYFDAGDLSAVRDSELQERLNDLLPDTPWEVTNQAAVHHWFEEYFGHAVEPLGSLQDAVASWPEYVTCVGLTLHSDASIEVIAPYGLGDLFNGVVRHNPTRASLETYRERVALKQYVQRWPRVRVVTD